MEPIADSVLTMRIFQCTCYHNVGSMEKLYAQVDRFAETIFANEFSDTRPESESILAEQSIERDQVMPTVGADISLTTERMVVTL
jgi:hypothetical protein